GRGGGADRYPERARRRRVPAVGDWLGRRARPRDPRDGGVGPRRDVERGASTIQRDVSRAAENIRARWRGVMARLTRREFLRTSASGAGLALLAAGCGPAIKGEFELKACRRVVVIGDGCGGSSEDT